MYRLKTEEYKALLESYKMCLQMYFPDLKIQCFETEFVINECVLQYIDIAGVIATDVYLIIKMKNCIHIHLPIKEGAHYYTQSFPGNDKQSLFTLWGDDIKS